LYIYVIVIAKTRNIFAVICVNEVTCE
jgi:hypothetical protein